MRGDGCPYPRAGLKYSYVSLPCSIGLHSIVSSTLHCNTSLEHKLNFDSDDDDDDDDDRSGNAAASLHDGSWN